MTTQTAYDWFLSVSERTSAQEGVFERREPVGTMGHVDTQSQPMGTNEAQGRMKKKPYANDGCIELYLWEVR